MFACLLAALLTLNPALFAPPASLAATAATTNEPVDNSRPIAVVSKVIGDARAGGRKLIVGYSIDYATTVTTGDRSFVQLSIDKWNNKINIGPNSSMAVNFQDEKKYVFESGTCRWEHNKTPTTKGKNKAGAPKGAVHTRHVSLGIRGTDFLLRVNPDFEESELYLLDGEVEMTSATNKMDSVLVKAGQWVGLGGRFGDKIHGPIQMSPEHVKRLSSAELVW